MKTFKRLMCFALALLMLASVIPTSIISARAAPTDAEMMDNSVLDAMEYLGFNMNGFKSSGKLYTEAGVKYAPLIRYDDKYWGDKTEGTITGLNTTTDPVTGATVPDVAKFEQYGLVCASYITYYYLNYLPNVKGVDVSDFREDMQYWKDKTGLSWQGAWLWRYALEKISADSNGSVTKIYYARYNATEKDNYGNTVGKKPTADDYAKMAVGDIVTFGYEKTNDDGTKEEAFSHAAIYLGEKDGKHWISHCVPRSYEKNEKTYHVSVVFGTVEEMYSTDPSNPKPTSIVTGVYHIKNADHYEKVGKIEIYKEDPNGKPLAGAEFSVVNVDDPTIVFKLGPTDSDGYAMRKDLPFGTYVIKETVFPEGYTASGDTEWTRTLDANTPNGTITITAINEEETGTGKIIKKSTNGGTVEGWLFTVKDSSGNVVAKDRATNAEGVILVDLAPGTYTVTETGHKTMTAEKLKCWKLDDKTKTLTIKAKETTEITFENQFLGDGKLVIYKTDTNGKKLAGAVFTATETTTGKTYTFPVTNEDGYTCLENLPYGYYRIIETAFPAWHTSAGETEWFRYVTDKDPEPVALHIKNGIITKRIKIIKESTNGGTVEGWLFTVKDANGKIAAENLATDKYGELRVYLIPGTYYVTETGHQTMTAEELKSWVMDNRTQTVTIDENLIVTPDSMTFTNEFLGDGKLEIFKTNTKMEPLAGAVFTATHMETGKTYTFPVTDSYGYTCLEDLPFGKYKIVETAYPAWHTSSGETVWYRDVTPETPKPAPLNIKNQEVEGPGKIIKKSTNGGTVEGWLFTIKDANGKVVAKDIATNAEGVIREGLSPGTYYVTETGHKTMTAEELKNWVLDNETKTLVMREDLTSDPVTFTNQLISGKGKIVKTSTNGGTVEGWLFTIKDANGNVVAQNVATNSKGEILKDLAPGTYTVTETGHQSMTAAQKAYWTMDTAAKTMKVEAGKTATVNFTNQLNGKGKIVKTSTNGGTVEGWLFTIKDASGNVVAQNVATNSKGEILKDLAPGTYTVTETGHQSMTAAQKEYWTLDTSARTLTVEAGKTATVTFANQLNGKGKIVKTSTNGGTVEGWLFTVKDANGNVVAQNVATNSKGEILMDLAPGTYTVTETGHKTMTAEQKAYWKMDTSARTLTVEVGKTASVIFSNEFFGKGKIVKVAKNSSAAGWLFDIWRVTENGNEYIGEYVTLEDGTVTVDLLPGEYIVKEKIPENPNAFWIYDTEPKTITVEAGKTTETEPFVNIYLGRGRIIKATNIGKDLGGWIFGVYSDPTCTDENLITTITTADEDNTETGSVYGQTVFYLEPGTYYVKEIGFVDGRYDDDDWAIDPAIKEVVIVAGAETSVQFDNIMTKGKVEVVKKSTNGGTVIGWQFSIKGVDNDYSEIVTITDELNGAGIITKELTAGTYIITEIGHSDPAFDMTYWELDAEPKTVTIEVEKTASVEYTNIYKGGITVHKTLEDPTSGTVEGWEFKIEKVVMDKNGNYIVESTFVDKTDANGQISSIVEPGTYRITEILDENSPWAVVGDNPKVVEVVAGLTNTVEFVNTLRSGTITIYKINPGKQPLSGAVFLLEWSEDGVNWVPVIQSESVTKGGCTNENLVDGTLTTGDDGVISFTGLHPMMQYRVTEVKAPAGYMLLADYVYVGALPAETLEVVKTVINSPGFAHAATGEFGTSDLFTGLAMAFFAMVMFASAALYCVLNGMSVKKNISMKGSIPMKKRIFSVLLVLCLTISMAVPAFAATAETATIDTNAKGSIELYKYDMTAATDSGVFQPGSFVSTGTPNEEAENTLAPYAIKGVVFSYHKVADITTYSVTETINGEYIVKNLYAMPAGSQTNDLLAAIGLTVNDAYPVEEGDSGYLYFTSDVLSNALRSALATNSSVVKDKLMRFNASYNSPKFAETSETGYAKVDNLDLGLYIIVETYVPEQVKQTTAPFFVSVPSTSNDGAEWNYDLTYYPKNETDYPTLDKTVREDKVDTGKHNGTTDKIGDGYASTATGSDGDVMNYQIVSGLPTITSDATNLTCYSFLDTLSKGIEYNKNDVKIEWFKDAACEELIATWTETDATKKFRVTYGTAENDATTMLIEMTEAGLAEINGSATVYSEDSIYDGYSDCYIRITYSATVNSNADVVYGNGGNPNEVVLTWKRTNTEYFDTLKDCCHVFVYGIDLTKKFDDALGNFANVNFVIFNETDGYWVVAEQDATTGIYYVTDHVENEDDATVFVPTEDGSVFVLGLEDDTYVITETKTDDNYVLLRDAITVAITAANEGEQCECGAKMVVASAAINGKNVSMINHENSANAVVTLTVVNNRGFDQPQTGDEGTVMLTVCGTMAVVSGLCLCLLVLCGNKKKHQQ